MGFSPGLQGYFNIHKPINAIHRTNRRKEEKHLIVSTDTEKTSHPNAHQGENENIFTS